MKKILLMALLPALQLTSHADNIESILSDIEKNNIQLQALKHSNKADGFDIDAENRLDATSIEYSPFFRRGAGGVASSEFIVAQEFDFPTLYSARSKSGSLQKENNSMSYMATRRDILLDAKQKYLDLVLLSRTGQVLSARMRNSNELLALYEKKFKAGDATALDLNKLRMEQMDLNSALLQNESAYNSLVAQLELLNAGHKLQLDSVSYPVTAIPANYSTFRDEVISGDITIRSALSEVSLSEQQLSVSKQGWLPKLKVGYRRNTEGDESSNGFVIGATFPLFSTGSRVKAAKIRKEAAILSLDNTRMTVENETKTTYDEIIQLSRMIAVYDINLIQESLDLLKKSVESGHTTILDYYTEADKIYQQIETYLSLENRYNKLLAELYKNKL